jgi:hypothetical protein
VYVNEGGAFMMSGGGINPNTANDDGGGVYVNEKDAFMMNGGFIGGNTASRSGGGVYVGGGTFTMSSGFILENTASKGGGVYADGGTFTMSDGSIIVNTANDDGGGVYVNEKDAFMMNGGFISGNRASDGGGVYFSGSGTFTMSDGSIINNTASGGRDYQGKVNAGNGGGVYFSGGTFTMSGGSISGNWARSDEGIDVSNGGGVYVASGTFWLRGGTVHGREAGELANRASSGASLSIKDITFMAKYGDGSDILESGLATDATLTGHDQAAQAAAPAPTATVTTTPAAPTQNAPPASQTSVDPEKVYKIGDTGPGGGIVFYVERGNSGMEVSQLLGSYAWEEAVQVAKGFDGGGMNNWHLPTQDELALIYVNLYEAGIVNLGAIVYWSSSKQAGLFYVGGPVFCQRFSDGAQGTGEYSDIFAVRAVRVF